MNYTEEDMTPWFPHHVKPVRPGVYEVKSWLGRFAYFNGTRWGWAFQTKEKADRERCTNDSSQAKDWRGLNKEPV